MHGMFDSTQHLKNENNLWTVYEQLMKLMAFGNGNYVELHVRRL